MLDKLMAESKDKVQQNIDNLDNQYKISEFEKQTAKNGTKICGFELSKRNK